MFCIPCLRLLYYHLPLFPQSGLGKGKGKGKFSTDIPIIIGFKYLGFNFGLFFKKGPLYI